MADPDELLTLPDGRRTQLWQGGDPDGPAVLFLHGCPDTRWAARSGEVAARRLGLRLVAANRPGYGSATAHDSTHLSVADDTVAVADLLGIDRFAVLGMSVGGPYALACAARHPTRVRAVAVVAAPGQTVEMTPPCARDGLSPDQLAFYAQIAAVSTDEALALMRPEFEQFVARVDPADPDDEALARRWLTGLPPGDAELLAAISPAELAASVREALARPEGYLRDAALTFRAWEFRPGSVGCPTSLWYGELDENHPARNGHWLAAHVPGATLHVRPDTGHLGALLTQWDEILAALR